jgi:hypothetical protein
LIRFDSACLAADFQPNPLVDRRYRTANEPGTFRGKRLNVMCQLSAKPLGTLEGFMEQLADQDQKKIKWIKYFRPQKQ